MGAPERPEDVYDEFVADNEEIFGDKLVAVCAYGSAARGEYVRGKSDINMLVILDSAQIETLRSALSYLKKWKKRSIATPLFLTREYIMTSLDTFPIEYLEMKSCYQCLFGEDLLKGLSLERSFVRLQCEREIRSKLLRLRQTFLETGGEPARVRELIVRSIPTFVVLLKSLLYVKGEAVPVKTGEVFAKSVSALGLEEPVVNELLALKSGTSSQKKDETISFLGAYVAEMQKLAQIADEASTE